MAQLADRPIERMERREYASQLTMAMFGRRITWSAIAAGVIAGTFVQLLLGSLGGAIGATAVATGTGGAGAVSAGVGIWLLVSTVIAMFVGGWIAGRTSGIPRRSSGMLHGFLTASLGALFSMALLASAIGGAFGSVANLAGSGLQGASGNPEVNAQVSAVVSDAQAALNNVTPQEANQAADNAAAGTAAAGFGLFLLLLLACGSSIAGGFASVPRSQRMSAGTDPRI